MDKSDLSYIAGFFDGEGSINMTVRRRKNFAPEYTLSVAIGQNDGATLDWIKENLGGRIYRIKRDNSFFWTATNRQAENFLKVIIPYLRYKKPQAEVALSFYLSASSRRKPVGEEEIKRREGIRNELKRLKKVLIESRYAGSTTKRIDSESWCNSLTSTGM